MMQRLTFSIVGLVVGIVVMLLFSALLSGCIPVVASVEEGRALPVVVMPPDTPPAVSNGWGAAEWGALGGGLLAILTGGGLFAQQSADRRRLRAERDACAKAETDSEVAEILLSAKH